ncbi:uncharacterized protein K452DRAFT_285230 [Aplosporella prunicola CBS 121167]|uniref:Uncharacterized protein n=1 Tax=Aplosporella prunicola CBS 121167 TaxID=1176127 RepID=A0A6A6BL34_9PEZI|nr:uncharacterized protein K452DRAFT_285230 [Aplosporella prunicola CBS 121167]KAF2144025.1 hypothetical protein K452DRAFT_285230 [Aplosporella prunicola CBS 121167]
MSIIDVDLVAIHSAPSPLPRRGVSPAAPIGPLPLHMPSAVPPASPLLPRPAGCFQDLLDASTVFHRSWFMTSSRTHGPLPRGI